MLIGGVVIPKEFVIGKLIPGTGRVDDGASSRYLNSYELVVGIISVMGFVSLGALSL